MTFSEKNASADRRSLKTEAAIEKAFLELMSKKDIGRITVKEITDLADTNRGTFYLHYIDILDLQDKIEDKVIEGLCGSASEDFPLSARERRVSQITSMLEYIKENIRVFRAFLNSSRSMQFMDKLTFAIEDLFVPCIPVKMNEHDKDFSRMVSTFFVNGAAALIKDWFKRDDATSPDELSVIIDRIMSTGLSSFADPESWQKVSG